MKQIDSFTKMCVDNGYITCAQGPWLRYGIEKRVATLFISIPMIVIGALISSLLMAVSFYISFYLLRSRTNGFHAKTFGGCFALSILTEIFFLGILPRIWNETVAIALFAFSIVTIFTLAPYNHPSMNLSSEELSECEKSAKRRLLTLASTQMFMYVFRFKEVATGILLGIVMVSATLTFAYITKGEK